MTRPAWPGLIVFDCDGTIADTMPLHYEAWVAALKEHSVEFSEALFYELAGMPTADIVALLNETVPVLELLERSRSRRPPNPLSKGAYAFERFETTRLAWYACA